MTKEPLDLHSGILNNDSTELITINRNKLREGIYINGTYNEFYTKGKKHISNMISITIM